MPAVAQAISFLADWGCDLETALRLPRINATGDGCATGVCDEPSMTEF